MSPRRSAAARRELAAEVEHYRRQAKHLALALGMCPECGEQLTAGRCEGCALASQLRASIVEAERNAAAKVELGIACEACKGAAYVDAWWVSVGKEPCEACAGTGCREGWTPGCGGAEVRRAVKLTPDQRRRVRELMVDEGHARAEAVAWVLAFEPSEGAK